MEELACSPEEWFNAQRQIALITQIAWKRTLAEKGMTEEEWWAEFAPTPKGQETTALSQESLQKKSRHNLSRKG